MFCGTGYQTQNMVPTELWLPLPVFKKTFFETCMTLPTYSRWSSTLQPTEAPCLRLMLPGLAVSCVFNSKIHYVFQEYIMGPLGLKEMEQKIEGQTRRKNTEVEEGWECLEVIRDDVMWRGHSRFNTHCLTDQFDGVLPIFACFS